MSRSVFTKQVLKEKSPSHVFTAAATLGRHVFAGTKDGLIVFFEVTKQGTAEAREMVRLSKSVIQLLPFRRPSPMMLVLTEDGKVSIIMNVLAPAPHAVPVDVLVNVKVSYMAGKIQNDVPILAYQAMAGREKAIHLLRFSSNLNRFEATSQAPSIIPEDVKCMAWHESQLTLCFSRECAILDTAAKGASCTPFAAAPRENAAVVCSMPPMGNLVVTADEMALVMRRHAQGPMVSNSEVRPIDTRVASKAMMYAHPYLITLNAADGVQVHFPWAPAPEVKRGEKPSDVKTETLCQTTTIKYALMLATPPVPDFDIPRPVATPFGAAAAPARSRGATSATSFTGDSIFCPDAVVVVTSDNSLVLLAPQSLADQARSLYRAQRFGEASRLCEICGPDASPQILAELSVHYANYLLRGSRVRDAFQQLRNPHVPILSVLSFFPEAYTPRDLAPRWKEAYQMQLRKQQTAAGDVTVTLPDASVVPTREGATSDDANALRVQALEELEMYLLERRRRATDFPSTEPTDAYGGHVKRPRILTKMDLPVDEFDVVNDALIDTALLMARADRGDDAQVLEMLQDPKPRIVLEPSIEFLVRVGADGCAGQLWMAAGQMETALHHMQAVATTGNPTSATIPNTLAGAKELCDVMRRGTLPDAGAFMPRRTIEALVDKVRDHYRATVARQVGAVYAALALVRHHLVGMIDTQAAKASGPSGSGSSYGSLLGFSAGSASGAPGIGASGYLSSALAGATQSANPFLKLRCMWLFNDDALPASFLAPHLFLRVASRELPLVSLQALTADFEHSPAIREKFLDRLVHLERELTSKSGRPALEQDQVRLLHNLYVQALIDRIARPDVNDGTIVVQLQQFVSSSRWYAPDFALNLLKRIDASRAQTLIEVQAEILARCGKFKEAVQCLYKVDRRRAEQFCVRIRREDTKSESIACLLSEMMAHVRDVPKGVALTAEQEAEVGAAIALLKRHPWINPAAVWRLLPEATPIAAVSEYLALALQERTYRRHRATLLAEVERTTLLQRQTALADELAKSAEVRATSECGVCKRRIHVALIARYPNGTVVHSACAPDDQTDPVTRANFSNDAPPLADLEKA